MNKAKNSTSVYFSPFFSVSGVRRVIKTGEIEELSGGQLHSPILVTMITPLVTKTSGGYRLLNHSDARLTKLLNGFDSKTRIEVLEVIESTKQELERIEYLAGQVFPQITSAVPAKDFLSSLAASQQKQQWTAEAFDLQPQRKNTDAPLTVAGLTSLLGRNGPSHVTVGKALNGKQKSRNNSAPPTPPGEINILAEKANQPMADGTLDMLIKHSAEPFQATQSKGDNPPNLLPDIFQDDAWTKAADTWGKYSLENHGVPSFSETCKKITQINENDLILFISRCNQLNISKDNDKLDQFVSNIISFIHKHS
ncbi:hypothetical protein SAMN05660443_0658 [Marinospirillum celere]|uniref:Uncharacterized protein n=1 Tax=Marinospirillum celere TaxID=1122252 RepID=A0A1I1EK04_9GAMM|nr:hypothetical protein [Marinospirillum celere]SFB87435.1 hypothetical protein SAMN05660443_0658 [Marinospirillum celere]